MQLVIDIGCCDMLKWEMELSQYRVICVSLFATVQSTDQSFSSSHYVNNGFCSY